MFDTCFSAVYQKVSRHRRVVSAALLLLLLLAVRRLPQLDLDHNIEKMLPAREAVLGNIRFLRDSGFAEQVVLSVSLPDSDADPVRLMAAADRLAAALRGPLVSEVRTGLPREDLAEEWRELTARIPQMMEPQALQQLRRDLTPEEIERRMGALYRRLYAPGASMGRFMAADPLGIAGNVLNRMQELSAAFGYRVKPVGSHLLSEDERHLLLFLKTPVAVSDGFGARDLMDHIHARLADSPDRLQALIVAGHRHTVSNEAVVRSDLRRTGLAALFGFGLLLLAVFRDGRAGMIFMAPICAILFSIALSSLILDTMSYFIIGMSVVIAGIAMDYAIHSYVAKRGTGPAALPKVARPVAIGAITTAAVFTAFFFSSVPGYRQLAWFSIISLLICLGLAFFVLPQWIRTAPDSWKAWRWTGRRARGRAGQAGIVAAWLIGLGLVGISIRQLEFQRDIEQFDGSTADILDDQRQFHRIWGGERSPAMLVVEGRDQETVWRRYEEVSQRAADGIGAENVITLATLWPSRETRVRRLDAWREFWDRREPDVREQMAATAETYGFAGNAFQPFFDWLPGKEAHAGLPPSGLFDRLRERFVISANGQTWAVAYVEDTPAHIRRLSPLTVDEGTIRIRLVSRRVLSNAISSAVAGETVRLAAIAGILILCPLILLIRRPRLVALALLPVATAVVALLGVPAWLGMPLTAASLIAAMIVVGLVIDYGVYMVFDEHARMHADAALSVHLSAWSPLVGAGALLLARHPVMFDIGVTLVTGITAGYACAFWVVPALYRLTQGSTAQ